jgi:hypothetical protein
LRIHFNIFEQVTRNKEQETKKMNTSLLTPTTLQIKSKKKSLWTNLHCFLLAVGFTALVLCLKGCDPNISGSCVVQKPNYNATISDNDYQVTACRSYCHWYNTHLAETRQSICADAGSALRNQGSVGLHFTVDIDGTENPCHQWLATKASCDEYDFQYRSNLPSRHLVSYNPKSGKCNLLATSKTYWWVGMSFWCCIFLVILFESGRFCYQRIEWKSREGLDEGSDERING